MLRETSPVLFDPDWYRLRLARALVIDVDRRAAIEARCEAAVTPEEAWEQCAPLSWSHRAFFFVNRDESVSLRPSTVRHVRAFCAAPEAIETAETLARELVSRLVDHGATAGQSVRWRFWPRDLWRMGALPPARWSASDSPLVIATASLEDRAPLDASVVRAIEGTARDRSLVSMAIACARWDATSDERNPFEPLIELYASSASLVSLSPLELAIAD